MSMIDVYLKGDVVDTNADTEAIASSTRLPGDFRLP
jgi:hypothetical protein